MPGILKYFKRDDCLPDPVGLLSHQIPSSSIVAANRCVKPLLDAGAFSRNRGRYESFTEEEKANIAKTASEIGVTKAIMKLSKVYSDRVLKESTVRTWANKHKIELAVRKNNGRDTTISRIENKKRGRPLLLSDKLDKEVQEYLIELRSKGCVVNTAIVMSCAEGIIKNFDSNLLQENGGHICFTKHWARHLLLRMEFVKRRISTKSKVDVAEFECLKTKFLHDIKVVTITEEIPDCLVINWDQTGINYVPVSNWTMEKEGSRRVEVFGADDKQQVTALFACSMAGDFLPLQIIYQGKSTKCVPKATFPSSWNITHSANHWSNEQTMEEYVLKILLPYIAEKRVLLNMPYIPALVILIDFGVSAQKKCSIFYRRTMFIL
jgi:hypothetical protein